MRLQGKVAIVTGAGAGMGRAVAEGFAREGARVVLVEIDPAHGEAAAAAIRSAGGDALFVAPMWRTVQTCSGWCKPPSIGTVASMCSTTTQVCRCSVATHAPMS